MNDKAMENFVLLQMTLGKEAAIHTFSMEGDKTLMSKSTPFTITEGGTQYRMTIERVD